MDVKTMKLSSYWFVATEGKHPLLPTLGKVAKHATEQSANFTTNKVMQLPCILCFVEPKDAW